MPDDGGPRTLRDEFAMAALPALIDKLDFGSFRDKPTAVVQEIGAATCGLAYAFADEMLKHRSKSPDPDSPLWEPEHKET